MKIWRNFPCCMLHVGLGCTGVVKKNWPHRGAVAPAPPGSASDPQWFYLSEHIVISLLTKWLIPATALAPVKVSSQAIYTINKTVVTKQSRGNQKTNALLAVLVCKPYKIFWATELVNFCSKIGHDNYLVSDCEESKSPIASERALNKNCIRVKNAYAKAPCTDQNICCN